MALGRRSKVVDTANKYDNSLAAKDNEQHEASGAFGSDPEKGEPRTRKMSRIGGPIPGIVGDSDADSALSVGKQLELEQANSIKYRTCSWQKVHCPFSLPKSGLLQESISRLEESYTTLSRERSLIHFTIYLH